MEVLSMIKQSLSVADGVNPITKHFRLVQQTSCAGPELVWKIYDAIRLSDGKVYDSLQLQQSADRRTRELTVSVAVRTM